MGTALRPIEDEEEIENLDTVIHLAGEAVDGNWDDQYTIFRDPNGKLWWRRTSPPGDENYEEFNSSDEQEIQNLRDYHEKLGEFINSLG